MTNVNLITIESALRSLAAGEQMPSFTKPQAAVLLNAIGAVHGFPSDVQSVGLMTLRLLLQASRADAITERTMRIAASDKHN